MIPIAYAQGSATDAAKGFLVKIEENILFPIISLLFAVALLMFLWGMYEFVANAENEEARATGRNHILYGVIGMVIMLSALAILKIAAATFGVTVPS